MPILLEGGGAFDFAVGMSEEIVDLCVESVLFEYGDGVARVGDDPQVGLRDVLCDKYGMGDGDDVVVAADDQGRAVDLVQLVQGYIGLKIVEVGYLELIF